MGLPCCNQNPVGNKEIHINLRDEEINPDGAVCDAEGYLWNAQWGASRVARYAPDGTFHSAIDLPVSQVTCPAFGGDDLKTMYITSANENLPKGWEETEPLAGQTFRISLDVEGQKEHRAIIS